MTDDNPGFFRRHGKRIKSFFSTTPAPKPFVDPERNVFQGFLSFAPYAVKDLRDGGEQETARNLHRTWSFNLRMCGTWAVPQLESSALRKHFADCLTKTARYYASCVKNDPAQRSHWQTRQTIAEYLAAEILARRQGQPITLEVLSDFVDVMGDLPPGTTFQWAGETITYPRHPKPTVPLSPLRPSTPKVQPQNEYLQAIRLYREKKSRYASFDHLFKVKLDDIYSRRRGTHPDIVGDIRETAGAFLIDAIAELPDTNVTKSFPTYLPILSRKDHTAKERKSLASLFETVSEQYACFYKQNLKDRKPQPSTLDLPTKQYLARYLAERIQEPDGLTRPISRSVFWKWRKNQP